MRKMETIFLYAEYPPPSECETIIKIAIDGLEEAPYRKLRTILIQAATKERKQANLKYF